MGTSIGEHHLRGGGGGGGGGGRVPIVRIIAAEDFEYEAGAAAVPVGAPGQVRHDGYDDAGDGDDCGTVRMVLEDGEMQQPAAVPGGSGGGGSGYPAAGLAARGGARLGAASVGAEELVIVVGEAASSVGGGGGAASANMRPSYGTLPLNLSRDIAALMAGGEEEGEEQSERRGGRGGRVRPKAAEALLEASAAGAAL